MMIAIIFITLRSNTKIGFSRPDMGSTYTLMVVGIYQIMSLLQKSFFGSTILTLRSSSGH